MVQVGIRATRFDRGHWESTLGVRQFWADECRAHPSEAIDAVIAHLRSAGVTSVYFSNDIDGTDAAMVKKATSQNIPVLQIDGNLTKLAQQTGTDGAMVISAKVDQRRVLVGRLEMVVWLMLVEKSD